MEKLRAALWMYSSASQRRATKLGDIGKMYVGFEGKSWAFVEAGLITSQKEQL